jgi:hypothetical protein
MMKEKYNYDEQKMYDDDDNFPFKVKDIVFISILYNANKSMLRIGEILDEDTSRIRDWTSSTGQNKTFTSILLQHRNWILWKRMICMTMTW